MTWRCAHIDETESFYKPALTLRPRTDFQEMLQGLRQPLSHEFHSSGWANFTRLYSAQELTYETDTFPAISGIVQRIQKITGDAYYAGLWKRHFLEGLLWYLGGSLTSREGQGSDSRPERKRKGWIAPSWSWASVVGNIDYSHAWPISGCFCARLEECVTFPSGLDPFGALKAGFARITGAVTSITHISGEESEFGRTYKILLGNGRRVGAWVKLDFVRYKSCNALMITPDLGICIVKVKGTANTYIRVGYFEIMRRLTASDHVPPRTITLV